MQEGSNITSSLYRVFWKQFRSLRVLQWHRDAEANFLIQQILDLIIVMGHNVSCTSTYYVDYKLTAARKTNLSSYLAWIVAVKQR